MQSFVTHTIQSICQVTISGHVRRLAGVSAAKPSSRLGVNSPDSHKTCQKCQRKGRYVL